MHPEDLRNALRELALDLRWSWNHASDELWSELDPILWAQTHNPWVVLRTTSNQRLQWASSDPAFEQKLQKVLRERQERAEQPRWFRGSHPDAGLTGVAYFSLEYMLSDALPIYSGGLGNVAGDQLKAASDLGVPVIGIGLLYQQGYFRQHIDEAGRQQAFYPFNDLGQLPVGPVRDSNGEWLRIPIAVPGSTLWLRAWHVHVGDTKLYLLDTNDLANLPEYRGITSELYGGGPELRLQQERVLGIGGWRLLRALHLQPEVCHLNEGHAAFAVLERARDYMEQIGHSFSEALTITRTGNLFTTHTPVAAGFDQFHSDLMRQFLREYAEWELRIPFAELMALGRRNSSDQSEPFNMAYLAIRSSGAINGVSRLHGEVSRRIFQPLFPRWPRLKFPSAMRRTESTRQHGTRRPRMSYGHGRVARIGGGTVLRRWTISCERSQHKSSGACALAPGGS
jgi:starch phosphorylase